MPVKSSAPKSKPAKKSVARSKEDAAVEVELARSDDEDPEMEESEEDEEDEEGEEEESEEEAEESEESDDEEEEEGCLLYTSPSPRDSGKSRMPSSA